MADQDEKPRRTGGDKPYRAPRSEYGAERPYRKPRSDGDGDDKPFRKPYKARGEETGSDKPARKPYGKPRAEGDAAGKPFGKKPGKPGDKPAKHPRRDKTPPQDASDTSRRFTPPGRPGGDKPRRGPGTARGVGGAATPRRRDK